MTIYRLKPPTFEARQFTGLPEDLTNGFFEWLGNAGHVDKANATSIRISIERFGKLVPLEPGCWVLREESGATLFVCAEQEFSRLYEVNE